MLFLLLGGLLSNNVSFLDSPQDVRTLSAAVYRAALEDARCSGLGVPGARGRELVVVRNAVTPTVEWWWNAFPHEDFATAIPKWLPGIEPGTLQSFLRVTASPTLLDVAFADGQNVEWISREEIDALAKLGFFWEQFYKRHPSATGVIQLSAVGFAPDRRQALVYCAHTSESLSGEGYLVLLRENGRRWNPTAWRQVWQS